MVVVVDVVVVFIYMDVGTHLVWVDYMMVINQLTI